MLAQKRLRDMRKARGHAATVKLLGGRDLALLGHTHGQSTFAHSEVEPTSQRDAAFGQQIAARDSHVDGALGTQDRDVLGAQKGDVDRHFAAASKQASLGASKAQASFFQKLASHVGQPAFTGNPDSQIIHRGTFLPWENSAVSDSYPMKGIGGCGRGYGGWGEKVIEFKRQP